MASNILRSKATVNLSNLKHNISRIKELVSDEVSFMLVVKANAYGLGAVEISKYAENIDFVSYFGVATSEEAEILRRNGIKKPILILGYGLNRGYEEILDKDVSFCIFDYESALELSNTAKKKNVVAKVHIKIDTGMSRIGFFNNREDLDIIEKICRLKNIEARGIFTHFADADNEDRGYTLKQLGEFNSCIDELKRRGISFKIKHCSNSAGILQYPEANFNMVRSGCMAYGLIPSPVLKDKMKDFKPVMSLEGTVVSVKELKEDRPVSYGGSFTAKKGSRIATVAIGYADGYPRALSNKSYVLFKGKRCRVIGNVCMDQLLVDVSGIDDIRPKDSVILIGESGNERITMEELSYLSNMINYELICGIGDRVHREYVFLK